LGSGVIDHGVLNIAKRWTYLASHTGRFTPEERAPWYPLVRRPGESQSRSGRSSEEKLSLPCCCRESNTGCPARGLVPILTELPRLLHFFMLSHEMETDWNEMLLICWTEL